MVKWMMNQDKKEIEVFLNSLVKIISKYCRGGFEEQLPVKSDGSLEDGVSVGINLLGQELSHHLQNLRKAQEDLQNLNRLFAKLKP